MKILVDNLGRVVTIGGNAIELRYSEELEISSTWTGSQSDYDAISQKESDKLYLIQGAVGYTRAYLGEEPLYRYVPLSEDTSEGILPLTFMARSGAVVSLVRYGKCVQNGTPTPDAPVDIVCNNGVLKARHQSGLPLEYTLLDYARSSGTQYIDLGYKGNGNTKVEIKFKYHTVTSATGSGRVFGSRISAQNDAFAIGTSAGTVSATTNKIFWCYDSQSFFVVDENLGLDVWKTVVFGAKEHSVDGVSAGEDYNIVEFETPQTLKLFGFDNNGPVSVGYVDIAYCKLWDNGVLIRDLIPAKNSSNVIGMYDRANNQFYDNDGTGDFVAGPNAVDPITIVADGTVETIDVHGKNLFNPNNLPTFTGDLSYIVGHQPEPISDGFKVTLALATNTTYTYYLYLPIEEGYVYSCEAPSGGRFGTLNNKWAFVYSNRGNGGLPAGTVIEFHKVQLELGSTATEYQPYFDGGTATTEMLLKVGDYQDVQSILDGEVTRKVGIKVLDGTENWSVSSTYLGSCYTSALGQTPTGQVICSHFQNASSLNVYSRGKCYKERISLNLWYGDNKPTAVADLKQFLADQYAAGTPVIIVYPLATSTTETVTG